MLAQAPSTTTSYTTDINGNRVPVVSITSTGNSRVERSQTVNGRSVPVEQVEDKVVREDASGKTVERTIRRFDESGNALPIDRITIAETKQADGSTLIDTTVRRGDANGNLVLSERTRAETRKNGASTVSEITVERASINGSLEVSEKQSVAAIEQGQTVQQTSTVLRRDANGNFFEARRDIKDTTKAGSTTMENVAVYEPGSDGRLTLSRQEARTVVKSADGSERSQINVFDSAAGRVGEAATKPQLREQVVIEKRVTGDGVVETQKVRQANPNDPTRLGETRVILESVCKGKCS
jgi:hypothetical protein